MFVADWGTGTRPSNYRPPSSRGGARPADWLPLPEVFAGEQKITALFAVFNNTSNFVAFTIGGAYTVDWGDGTIQSFAAGATAQRNYAFSTINAGTLSTLGYRQAIITVTPQAGQDFTSVNFAVKHPQAGLQSSYAAGWLDINMAGALISSLVINSYLPLLRRFNFPGVNAVTNFTSFCQGCYSLVSLPAINTAAGTNFTNFCLNCVSLVSLPAINTAAGTNFTNFCQGCFSLVSLPAINTAAGTNFTNFCLNCVSLVSLPAINTAAGTNFTNFCQGCVSLSRSRITGASRTISYANMRLGAVELAEIFDNLSTATGQAITISGNWGASLLTSPQRAIATGKGWTLIG
jgi:hypothetical protein